MPRFVLLSILFLGLAACGNPVLGQRPVTQKTADSSLAVVYLIRPSTERMMGFADNPLAVDLNGTLLLHLDKGTYVRVQLPPGNSLIGARTLATYGPSHKIKELQREQSYTFAAGRTYFIALRPIDGEFRGAYFLPQQLDLMQAQQMTAHLRAVGEAKKSPITALTAD